MSARRANAQECEGYYSMTADALLEFLDTARPDVYQHFDRCLASASTANTMPNIPHIDEWIRILQPIALARLSSISARGSATQARDARHLLNARNIIQHPVNTRSEQNKITAIRYFARFVRMIPSVEGMQQVASEGHVGAHAARVFTGQTQNIWLPTVQLQVRPLPPSEPLPPYLAPNNLPPPPPQALPARVSRPPSGPRPAFAAAPQQQAEPTRRYIHNVLRVRKEVAPPPRGWRGTWKHYPHLLKNINRAPANAAPANAPELQLPQLQLLPEFEKVLKGLKVYEMFVIIEAYYRFLAKGQVPRLRDILPSNIGPIEGDDRPLPIINLEPIPPEMMQEIAEGLVVPGARGSTRNTRKQAPLLLRNMVRPLLLKNKPRPPAVVMQANMFNNALEEEEEEAAQPSGPVALENMPRSMVVPKRITRSNRRLQLPRGPLTRVQWLLANGIPLGITPPRRVLRPRDEAREAAEAFQRMLRAYRPFLMPVALTNTRRAKKRRNESKRKQAQRYPTFLKSFFQFLIMLLAAIPQMEYKPKIETALTVYFSLPEGKQAGVQDHPIEFFDFRGVPPMSNADPLTEPAPEGYEPPTTTFNAGEVDLNAEEAAAERARAIDASKKAWAERTGKGVVPAGPVRKTGRGPTFRIGNLPPAEEPPFVAEGAPEGYEPNLGPTNGGLENLNARNAANRAAEAAAKEAAAEARRAEWMNRTGKTLVPAGNVQEGYVVHPRHRKTNASDLRKWRNAEEQKAVNRDAEAARKAANDKKAADAADTVAALNAKLPKHMETVQNSNATDRVQISKNAIDTGEETNPKGKMVMVNDDTVVYFSWINIRTPLGFINTYAVKMGVNPNTTLKDFYNKFQAAGESKMGSVHRGARGALKGLFGTKGNNEIMINNKIISVNSETQNRPIADFL